MDTDTRHNDGYAYDALANLEQNHVFMKPELNLSISGPETR